MIAIFVGVSDSLKIVELQQRIHDLELQTRSFWDAMPTGIGWIALVLAVVLGVLTWVVGYNAWKAVQTPQEITTTLKIFRAQMDYFDQIIKTNMKSIVNVFRSKALDAFIAKDHLEEIANVLHVIVLTGDESERVEMIDQLMKKLEKDQDQLTSELDKDKQLRIAVFGMRLDSIPTPLTEVEKAKIKLLDEKLTALRNSLDNKEQS